MRERARQVLGGLLGLLIFLMSSVLIEGSTTGVVREHCLDLAASRAAQSVRVDTHWTYILWPPLLLASADPAGRCVRNPPVREGLAAIGLWSLPSPEEQVRQHVVSQLRRQ